MAITPEDWDHIRVVFEEARAKPPSDRRALFELKCPGRQDLVEELEALFEVSTVFTKDIRDATEPSADGSMTGSRVGPYILLDIIGEGGFGVVFRAEQRAPIHRRVALKIVKPGMQSREVVSRFLAERQALALMDHPCIAQVFDAGTTSGGLPYFVMELVKGIPITRFADQNRLSIDDRLRLFTRICDAVQHAHSKGVIHRDIKPGNILVEYVDGEWAPKIIDFGVAKALDQRLTENTIITRHGQVIGTPEYMSPEQAGISGLDVDTRSDVYSLGVLLYELLTGHRPFDLSGLDLPTILQVIQDEEPSKPSSRISSESPKSRQFAMQRRMDAITLTRRIRGDLDWIVMKALEKDRARRYQTASALGDDIRRYMSNLPVEAGPPSSLYRLSRFWKRNRIYVSAAVLLFGVLIVIAAVFAHAARTTKNANREIVREKQLREADAMLAEGFLKDIDLLQSIEDPDLAGHEMIKDSRRLRAEAPNLATASQRVAAYAESINLAKKAQEARVAAINRLTATAENAVRLEERLEAYAKVESAISVIHAMRLHGLISLDLTMRAIGGKSPETAIKPFVLKPIRATKAFGMGTRESDHAHGSVVGCLQGPRDERQRPPTAIEAFEMSKFEITRAQYFALIGDDPTIEAPIKEDFDDPVTSVTFFEAALFCNRLSDHFGFDRLYEVVGDGDKQRVVGHRPGRGFRLPNEAEWEYAARAGKPGVFPFAGTPRPFVNFRANTAPDHLPRRVGGKRPNGFGLHDTLGNCLEWTEGCMRFDKTTTDYLESSVPFPSWIHDTEYVYCRARGGSTNHVHDDCRPGRRFHLEPNARLRYVGFRVALCQQQ